MAHSRRLPNPTERMDISDERGGVVQKPQNIPHLRLLARSALQSTLGREQFRDVPRGVGWAPPAERREDWHARLEPCSARSLGGRSTDAPAVTLSGCTLRRGATTRVDVPEGLQEPHLGRREDAV